MRTRSFVLCLLAAFAITAQAKTSAVSKLRTEYDSVIRSNEKLQEQLRAMGYETVDAAVDAFAENAAILEKSNINYNVGTLAICGEASAKVIKGIEGMVCTTLFNAYFVGGLVTGLAAGIQLNANAIYFYDADNGKNDQVCYSGAELSFSKVFGAKAQVMKQIDCFGLESNDYEFKPGFFALVGATLGYGASLARINVSVHRLFNYWTF